MWQITELEAANKKLELAAKKAEKVPKKSAAGGVSSAGRRAPPATPSSGDGEAAVDIDEDYVLGVGSLATDSKVWTHPSTLRPPSPSSHPVHLPLSTGLAAQGGAAAALEGGGRDAAARRGSHVREGAAARRCPKA